MKPLKAVALPFTTYVHTNDPVGYVSFNGATPYGAHGYVDITRLSSVLMHRKCRYDGNLNVSYRHVAVFDKSVSWQNVLVEEAAKLD